jgi:Zn-dependent protease with chaperone function
LTELPTVTLPWTGIFCAAQSVAVVLLPRYAYLLASALVFLGAAFAGAGSLLGVMCLWTLLVAGYARLAVDHRGAGGPEAHSMSFVNLIKSPYTSLAEWVPVHWIPPDLLSAASVAAACPAVYFGAKGEAATAATAILASLALDCLDGVSARHRANARGRSTTLRGQAVDIACDKAASTLALLAMVGLVSGSLVVVLAGLSIWSLFRLVYPWAGGGIETRVLCLICLAFPEPESYAAVALFAVATAYSTVVRTWKLRAGGGIHHWGWARLEMRPLATVAASASLLVAGSAVSLGTSPDVLLLSTFVPAVLLVARLLQRSSALRVTADLLLDLAITATVVAVVFASLRLAPERWELVSAPILAASSLLAAPVLLVVLRRTTKPCEPPFSPGSSATAAISYREVSPGWRWMHPVAFCAGRRTIVVNPELFDALSVEKQNRVLEHERHHCASGHFAISLGVQAVAAGLVPLVASLMCSTVVMIGLLQAPGSGFTVLSLVVALVWARVGSRSLHRRIEHLTNKAIAAPPRGTAP